MKLKHFFALIIIFLEAPAFSQSEIKVSCKFYVDSIEVINSDTELEFTLNNNKQKILTDKSGQYFLMDTNLLKSETIDIELKFKDCILVFKGLSNWLKNYDMSFFLFQRSNFQRSNGKERSKYKYFMRLEPRLTDDMVKAAISNARPYNNFRTIDYYVY